MVSVVLLYPRMGAALGINYGRIADNLPPPEKAVLLIKSLGATRVKLYDADPTVLTAFANTNIEIIVGLGNEYLVTMQEQEKALSWVKTNVQCHLPATKINCIAVGNEVLTSNDTSLAASLLPAMQNLYSALTILQLDRQVTVTTTHSMGILETSYPPSSGKFRQELVGSITKILDFNTKIDSPFLINAYPFLAYKSDPKQIPLNFVLFDPDNDNEIINDPVTKFLYHNMLFAQIDAVHAALEKVGCNELCVQISESGWPSKGDPDEVGASSENAKKYNGNLIKLMKQKTGTPMRPNENLNIYLFALFNENLKPGPTSERNFGLFKNDGTPAYSLGVGGSSSSNGNSSSSSNNGGSSSGGGGSGSSGSWPYSPAAGGGSSNGYPYIYNTSNVGRKFVQSRMLIFVLAISFVLMRLEA
ncbi:glucosidase [Lithospermum erythrorhizon]|uniref:glucan endo-1,3-beta-D-glucosidase n=1 Tax=Lithospermum erythrorhizon TaxID=34254 RepID=A0AAV3R9N7_LITER